MKVIYYKSLFFNIFNIFNRLEAFIIKNYKLKIFIFHDNKIGNDKSKNYKIKLFISK